MDKLRYWLEYFGLDELLPPGFVFVAICFGLSLGLILVGMVIAS